ncbi:MAG: hypothetical protein A4S14_07375 [Proteobacteria bacterium SG_bin9]|nr:MAG: hypothetical protein A4S14_07375 [Proteobacteria bacterium SG_bin9]
MSNAAWLDTVLFAPRALASIEADGLASRPDIRFIRTKTGKVRVRAQIEDGKPVVIVFPDGPNIIEHYDPIFEAFRGKYSLVAIEPPGLGFSYAHHPDALGFKGTVQAVVAVIEAMQLERLIVTGSCVQAYLAIAIAAALPDRTLGVIAAQATDMEGQRKWTCSEVDPQGFLREPVVGQMAWARSVNRERFGIDAWYKIAAGSGVDIAGWQETARWSIRCGACHALATLIQSWFDGEPIDIPVWNGPAVIMFGLADATHLRAGSNPEGLRAYVPNAEMCLIERAGHFPELEALSEYAGAIDALVNKAAIDMDA